MPAGVIALALGAFGIGMTEFVPIGLLPQMAREFDVSIPLAGWIVTVYAVGVVVGALPLIAMSLRMPRKVFLVSLMVLFIIGNLATALAPVFEIALVGRVLSAFAHGAFYGVGAVVAAGLVHRSRRSAAIAAMFTGLTLANLIGVPAGTWLAEITSWRITFIAIAAFGLLSAIALLRYIPALPATPGIKLRHEFRAAGDVRVIFAMLATLFGFGGVFAAITYLAPMMTEHTGFPESSVTWLLIVLGLGMVIGNWAGGRLADKALVPTVITSLSLLAVMLLVFTFTAASQPLSVISIFLIGASGFATVPPLQAVVMSRAAAAPNLASTLNIGAFNLGNAVAAWLGGLTIAGGLGYASPNWVGAIMTAVGLIFAALSFTLARRGTPTTPDNTGHVRTPKGETPDAQGSDTSDRANATHAQG